MRCWVEILQQKDPTDMYSIKTHGYVSNCWVHDWDMHDTNLNQTLTVSVCSLRMYKVAYSTSVSVRMYLAGENLTFEHNYFMTLNIRHKSTDHCEVNRKLDEHDSNNALAYWQLQLAARRMLGQLYPIMNNIIHFSTQFCKLQFIHLSNTYCCNVGYNVTGIL